MKIQGYKIGSEIIGIDINTWSDDQLNGNPPFKSSVDLDPLYGDISSILNWYMFGTQTKSDYNSIREAISSIVISTGFDNLDLEEKIIAAKYFLANKAQRDSVLSEDEQKNAWNDLVQSSLNCRSDRWTKAKSYISYNLDPYSASDLAISTSELCQNYINYNITSNAICGKDGLYDFIEGTSSYSSNGYPSKSYWKQSDQDVIMSILTTGV